MASILYRKTESGEIVEERCEAKDVAHNLTLDCYEASPEDFKPKRGRKKKTEEE